ncbi:hypothetical protein DY000_02003855 [Brassica cretica]|uniref:Uncharacterized protein n=1 Tax=Brassica cretica TaxID=69181 RepID=A0ABQ7BT72_BRACR|nr:hypothetical protein DY000_02003855 [Brassica cretica]
MKLNNTPTLLFIYCYENYWDTIYPDITDVLWQKFPRGAQGDAPHARTRVPQTAKDAEETTHMVKRRKAHSFT